MTCPMVTRWEVQGWAWDPSLPTHVGLSTQSCLFSSSPLHSSSYVSKHIDNESANSRCLIKVLKRLVIPCSLGINHLALQMSSRTCPTHDLQSSPGGPRTLRM